MKTKVLNILFITFFTSLSIYTIVKSDFFERLNLSFYFSLNFLSSKEIEKSILQLIEFYKNAGLDYKYNPPKGSEEFNSLAEDIFSDEDVKWIKEIFTRPITIFFFILIIFLIIAWIPFCCCICCKCCLCTPEKILKYSKIFAYICFAICLAILISCLVGYKKNSNILHGIFSLGCSVLKIGHHLIAGDDYKVKPYWSGITPIVTILNETKLNISNLLFVVKETNERKKEVDNIFLSFSYDLYQEYHIRKNATIVNPEPNQELDLIIPKYLNFYGPPSETNTTLLGGIQEELGQFNPFTTSLLIDILEIIDLPTKVQELIDKGLSSAVELLDENINSIDKTIGNALGEFGNSLEKFDSFMRSFMNILFTVNIVLILIITLSLILIFFYKFGHCLLCFSWFFLYLFMILSLILGCIFLIIGLFIQNISSGISNFIVNIEKKRDTDFPETAINIIDVCFNKDGLLIHSNVFPPEFNSTVVEKIYSVETDILKDINDLNNYEFISTNKAENQYNEFINNPKTYINELEISLNNIQTYIDNSIENTHVSTESNFKDRWELKKEDCQEEYKYISPNTKTSGEKSCLILTEWKNEEIQERYKEIKSKDEININEIIDNYYNSIINCVSSNEELVSEIKKQNNRFKQEFVDLKKNIIEIFNNILKVVKPFRESYSSIVGDGSIFNILNCNFFKRDFNKLLEVLYIEFGTTFRKTSDIFLTICIFESIMTLLTLVIIEGFLKKDKNVEVILKDNNDLSIGLKEVKGDDNEIN